MVLLWLDLPGFIWCTMSFLELRGSSWEHIACLMPCLPVGCFALSHSGSSTQHGFCPYNVRMHISWAFGNVNFSYLAVLFCSLIEAHKKKKKKKIRTGLGHLRRHNTAYFNMQHLDRLSHTIQSFPPSLFICAAIGPVAWLERWRQAGDLPSLCLHMNNRVIARWINRHGHRVNFVLLLIHLARPRPLSLRRPALHSESTD